MKSKYLLVILTLSIILTLNVACASEVWDETLELDETTYEISVDETQTEHVTQEETGSFKELADTITSTPTGEELKLNKSYEHASTDLANTIRITKSITIDGEGNTIDAKKSTGIFTVSADNVVLKNIIFKNSYSPHHQDHA